MAPARDAVFQHTARQLKLNIASSMKPQVKAPVSCLMRPSTKGGKNPPRPPAAPTSRSLPTACGKYCGTSLICQYMLIWYVNNPEETSYYVRRLEGAWQPLVFVNVILNWVVPFVVLLPRATKCNPAVLSKSRPGGDARPRTEPCPYGPTHPPGTTALALGPGPGPAARRRRPVLPRHFFIFGQSSSRPDSKIGPWPGFVPRFSRPARFPPAGA